MQFFIPFKYYTPGNIITTGIKELNGLELQGLNCGICGGIKAVKTRRDMIMTGANRRIDGGGGKGGKIGGRTRSDTVKTTIMTTDLEKLHLNIKP